LKAGGELSNRLAENFVLYRKQEGNGRVVPSHCLALGQNDATTERTNRRRRFCWFRKETEKFVRECWAWNHRVSESLARRLRGEGTEVREGSRDIRVETGEYSAMFLLHVR
jgi:hypothetical protein